MDSLKVMAAEETGGGKHLQLPLLPVDAMSVDISENRNPSGTYSAVPAVEKESAL